MDATSWSVSTSPEDPEEADTGTRFGKIAAMITSPKPTAGITDRTVR